MMAGESRFTYGAVGIAMGIVLIAGVAGFVIWGLTVGNQKAGALLLAAVCAPSAIAWLRMPIVFIVSGGRVTIRNMWGREQSWPVSEVVVPNADRPFRRSIAQETLVTDTGGNVLFRIYPFRGLNELVELLSPGSSAEAKERRQKSWWNRELL